jgi:SAM-dependent methyltransferase
MWSGTGSHDVAVPGLRRVRETLRVGVAMRHTTARLLLAKDLQTFLRVQCLGVLSYSGLARELRTGGTAVELVDRAGLADVELTTAVLELACSLRLARRRGDRYRIRGLRGRAIASGRAEDVAGLAEEAALYDSPIYAALTDHLRGLAPQPYGAPVGDVIAKASRVAEPLVGPWLAATVRSLGARSAIDIGCGTGVNLVWLRRSIPDGRLQGIDRDPGAVGLARTNLVGTGVGVEEADLGALPADLLGPWDVVLLAHNLYYWPPEERSAVLARIGDLAGGSGTVLALTAVPNRLAIARHLDLALRVTEGCWRLPTPEEMAADARAAGFREVAVRHLAPGTGMVALVASGRVPAGGTAPASR